MEELLEEARLGDREGFERSLFYVFVSCILFVFHDLRPALKDKSEGRTRRPRTKISLSRRTRPLPRSCLKLDIRLSSHQHREQFFLELSFFDLKPFSSVSRSHEGRRRRGSSRSSAWRARAHLFFTFSPPPPNTQLPNHPRTINLPPLLTPPRWPSSTKQRRQI